MQLQIAEWTQKTLALIDEVHTALLTAENTSGIDLKTDNLPSSPLDGNKPLTIVFVGQYSAGKSSILSMLTGDSGIAIGEGITTEKTQEYAWNGITVIDTPGIHSSLRPDHDETTYQAISKADMIVYVVTNELFDSELAAHFRKLAIERGKAGEMLLVVNKVCRGGKGQMYRDTLREGLRPVLNPISPDDLYVSFVDAKSWHDAQNEDDPEIRAALLERCGLEQFVANINKFTSEHGLAAQLTTPLYETEQGVSDAIVSLQPSTGDLNIDGIEEHLRQQRHILERCIRSIETEAMHIYFSYGDKIRAKGQRISAEIELGCDINAINEQLEAAGREVENLADECSQRVDEAISQRLSKAEIEMDTLYRSDFSVNLANSLSMNEDKYSPIISKLLQKSGTALQDAGSAVVRSASRTGATTVAKGLKDFSGTKLHGFVKQVGHFFGVKFKPHQAVKITRGLAKVGNAVAILGVVLDIGMNAKDDYDQKKAEQEIRKCRQDTRQSFNSVATDFEQSGRAAILDYLSNSDDGLDRTIKGIDSQIDEIRLLRKNKSVCCEELEKLLSRCRGLISEIQSAGVQ